MKKTRTHKSIIKNLWTYALAFLLVLSNFTSLIQATGEDPNVTPSTPVVEETKDPVEENHEEENTKPQEEIPEDQTKPLEEGEKAESTEEEKTIEEDTDESENDGLEISDPNVKPAVTKTPDKPKKPVTPTIKPVSIGDKEITGGGLIGFNQRKKLNLVCKIHVTIKDTEGNFKETKVFSINPGDKQPAQWSVTLDNEVQEGYKVYAKQEFGENNFSDEASVEVKKTLAKQYEDSLTMPTGEIWIEQYVANIVSKDEAAEAIDLLKQANPTIANDIKSVEFKISGVDPNKVASYIVTYTDNSKSEEMQALDLTVKEVTEKSHVPNINKTYVSDGQITITLDENIAAGTKIGIVQRFTDGEEKNFCDGGSCRTDKSTPIWVTVESPTDTFTYEVDADFLQLGQEFGIIVKEPRKLANCSKTEPEIKIPEKTKVRNPRALTEEDKKAIDKAIREANTVNGISKLPDGTGEMDGIPAFIEFDKDGNARIINPADVDGEWVDDYTNFKPYKNDDGSFKMKTGTENNVIKILAKDLVKNLKPDAPEIKLNESDKTKITINAKAVDTDANVITVSYTGSDNSNKTLKATRADDGTWSITEGEGSVDANGVITLEISKVKGGTDVTATVSDKGGIADDDKEALTSDAAEFKVTKAILVEALGGLSPVDMKKWVGDDLEWKNGVKAKDDATEENQGKINKLLEESGTTYTDVTDTTRTTVKSGDFTGKIKVTFDDSSFIEVADQNLYVSDLVSPSDKKNLPEDAIDVELKLGEGTKVNNTDGTEITGDKESPVHYKSYKVKPNTNLSTYTLNLPSPLDKTIFALIDVKTQDTYTEPKWKDSNGGTNFVASDSNKVFTATATKTFKVTLDPNSGSGTMDGATVNENGTYKLPENKFTPPENKEFAGWLVGDATTITETGTDITITGDTVIKASWKPIEFKVKFQTEAGASGTMADVTVTKGSEYELPTPTFTPEEGKEFAGWKVGDSTELKQVGEKIDISGDVTITATWKDIMVKVTYDANGGSGEMTGATQKKGSSYKLLANGFTAPANQKFKAWKIGETEYQPDAEITVNENTTVTAIWEDIEYKVTFNGNTGTGKMDEKLVKKGNEFELPSNGFTPPANKEFDGWMVGNDKKAVGDKITVNGDTVVKAIWKDKSKPNPEPNPGDTPGTNPG